ncbi:MAG TPA: phospholipase D-like domain-containing protein [Gemmatimonadaceae bacterium]|nr:phospholipase D-like domain-containing protein [Gemmatimonadaceae bacterium]
MSATTLLVALGALVLGGVLAMLFDVTRGTPLSRVVTDDGRQPPSVDEPAFLEAVEGYLGASLTPGHRLALHCNGDEIFPRLWRDVAAARRFVLVQIYYCQEGAVADALRDALVERARAGVEVRLLLDGFGSSLGDAYLASLRDAGVRVAVLRPLRLAHIRRLMHRAHLRAVVIDGEVGWAGGFGIADKWLGDGCREGSWRDSAARFEGPAVRQLLGAFGVCWAEATGELIASASWWTPRDPATRDGARAAVLFAAPTVGSTASERFHALTISGARRSLYLTNSYFVPDDDFRRLLCDAAKRGVDVRVLTPRSGSTDVPMTYLAGRARYEELLESGVRIFEYAPSMIHAKTIVTDGAWCTVGSMNADNRSAALNEEVNLLVHDAAFGAELERVFHDDLGRAAEIDLEQFRHRGIVQRGLEWGAHLLARIL